METWLSQWQDLVGNLIAGACTLIAGTLIFVEGNRQVAEQRRIRDQEVGETKTVTKHILHRLSKKLGTIEEQLSELDNLIDEFLEDQAQDEASSLPEYMITYRSLDAMLSQLAQRDVAHTVVSCLSDLVDCLAVHERDFRNFRDLYGANIFSLPGGGRQLSLLPREDAAKERSRELLILSGQNVREYLQMLQTQIAGQTGLGFASK